MSSALLTRPCGDGRVDACFFPRFLDDRPFDRRARGDAAADQVVEHAGIDRLRRAAAREPHADAVVRANEAVDVRGVGVDAEIAGGRALELEQRRRVELRAHGVALVAPGGEGAFARQLCSDLGHRPAALVGGAGERQRAVLAAHRGKSGKPLRAVGA